MREVRDDCGTARRYVLLSGTPIESVSTLLGHQSVKVTEKHYAPFVKSRQEQLIAEVRRSWKSRKQA